MIYLRLRMLKICLKHLLIAILLLILNNMLLFKCSENVFNNPCYNYVIT